MYRFVNKFVRFGQSEDGGPTVEFVLLFPFFISLFLMGFESGYYMVRSVMLERALDISVRDVRLGNGKVPQLPALKEKICEHAAILPDCEDSLQIEMVALQIAPGQAATLDGRIKCIDRRVDEDQDKYSTYDVGSTNQLVVVRACAVASPLFPTTGIGAGMKRTDLIGENYAMVATNAFITEPGTRAMAPYTPAMGAECNSGIGNGGEGCDPGESGDFNQAGDDAGDTVDRGQSGHTTGSTGGSKN